MQRTIGWCVVGQRTEHVVKGMAELSMERGVRISPAGPLHRPGAKCTAGPSTELEGTLTAGPCTDRAGTCVAGPCTGCAENLVPCNGQEGSVRRGRTRNRPESVRRSRAQNGRRRSRRGCVTDKREGCGGPAHGTGWQVPGRRLHGTRHDDCVARPYTDPGPSALRAVHGRGGQAHGGAVQQTTGWCVAGPNIEQVGKCLPELCMERGAKITRRGRA